MFAKILIGMMLLMLAIELFQSSMVLMAMFVLFAVVGIPMFEVFRFTTRNK